MGVTGISTEGDDTSCGRVRRFYLYYSLDGLRFQQYIDPAVGDVSTKDFLTRATQTLAQAQGKAPVKQRMIVDFPLTIIKKSWTIVNADKREKLLSTIMKIFEHVQCDWMIVDDSRWSNENVSAIIDYIVHRLIGASNTCELPWRKRKTQAEARTQEMIRIAISLLLACECVRFTREHCKR